MSPTTTRAGSSASAAFHGFDGFEASQTILKSFLEAKPLSCWERVLAPGQLVVLSTPCLGQGGRYHPGHTSRPL